MELHSFGLGQTVGLDLECVDSPAFLIPITQLFAERSQLVLDRTSFQLFRFGGFEYFWDLDAVFSEDGNQSCLGHLVEVFPQLLTVNLLLQLFF